MPRPGRLASIHLLTLYSITFFFFLPAFCNKLQHSIYYQESHSDRDQQISKFNADNDERLRHANAFFKNRLVAISHLPDTSGKNFIYNQNSNMDEKASNSFDSHKSHVEIAITIISVSRNRHKFDSYEPRYLSQTVWRYLHLLSTPEARQRSVQLSLCNVDSEPDTYYEIHNLSSIIYTFQRFSGKSQNLVEIFEKEKQDYVYCLNASLSWNPSYVLLVEDDSLPRDDLFPVMNYILDYIASADKRHESRLHFPDKWYMKLYHPERLLGYWSIEIERIPELLSLSFLSGLLIIAIYHCVGLKTVFTNINVSWLLLSLYFCLLFIAVGRQNLLELRRWSKYFYMITPSPSCCTPAILYTNATAKTVIDYLAHVHCKKNFAKDMALEQLRSDTGLKAYLLQPNLFKHIGLYSSLRTKILSPSVV